MKQLPLLLAGALLAASATTHAATFDFNGTIATHKDVIQIGFTLTQDATDVKVWTDSFKGGLNFDPITAVWKDGLNIGQNDDNGNIAPGQTVYDSGLTFSSLSAGNYLFTIATYNNWANGPHLSDGFNFDHDVAIPLETWCEPANGCGMGHNWSVHLSGVDGATPPPVPEPFTYAMLALGLGVMGAMARRNRQA